MKTSRPSLPSWSDRTCGMQLVLWPGIANWCVGTQRHSRPQVCLPVCILTSLIQPRQHDPHVEPLHHTFPVCARQSPSASRRDCFPRVQAASKALAAVHGELRVRDQNVANSQSRVGPSAFESRCATDCDVGVLIVRVWVSLSFDQSGPSLLKCPYKCCKCTAIVAMGKTALTAIALQICLRVLKSVCQSISPRFAWSRSCIYRRLRQPCARFILCCFRLTVMENLPEVKLIATASCCLTRSFCPHDRP